MFWDIVKLIGYLAVCVFIFWLAMKATKLYAGGAGRIATTRYIKLLDKMSFTKDSGVGIIQVGEKYMLISMATSGVSVLCELTEDELIDFRAENPEINIYDAVRNNVSPLAGKIAEKLMYRKNKGTAKKKNRKPKKGDFSKMLYDNVGGEEETDFSSQSDEIDSIVDELLKSSEKRAREYKDKTSNR